MWCVGTNCGWLVWCFFFLFIVGINTIGFLRVTSFARSGAVVGQPLWARAFFSRTPTLERRPLLCPVLAAQLRPRCSPRTMCPVSVDVCCCLCVSLSLSHCLTLPLCHLFILLCVLIHLPERNKVSSTLTQVNSGGTNWWLATTQRESALILYFTQRAFITVFDCLR